MVHTQGDVLDAKPCVGSHALKHTARSSDDHGRLIRLDEMCLLKPIRVVHTHEHVRKSRLEPGDLNRLAR